MIDIYEFADVINKQLHIIYYPNQDNRFSACFERGEIKEGIILISNWGDGKTPDEAVSNYVKDIEGKTIVFNSMSKDDRQEFHVPYLKEVLR